MSGHLVPRSRHVSSSLSLCAAVMLCIVCSDAARASLSPTSSQANSGVRQNLRSSLFPSNEQHRPLSTGRLSPEPGARSGTEMGRKFGEALSIHSHQSNPPRYTGGLFGYNPNSPDQRQQSQGGIIRAPRGHGSGGERPASKSFISHPEQRGQGAEGPQSRLHYQPLPQMETQIGNSYNSNPSIVSSQNLIWHSKDAPTPYNEVKVLVNNKVSWVSQPGKYWGNSPSTPRAHRGGYKQMNELSADGVKSTSNGIQSNRMFGSASQIASRAWSAINSLDTSASRSNPSSEKVTQRSSVTDFSLRLNPMTSGDTSRPKMVQSHLLKDSQASSMVTGDEQQATAAMPQKQRASEGHDRYLSNFVKFRRNNPIEGANANLLHLHKNVAQDRAQTPSLRKYQPVSSTYPPAQPSLHPTQGKGRTLEKFVPAPLAAFQDDYATSREKAPGGSSVLTPSGSAHVYEPDQSTKSLYGMRGFKNLRSNPGRYSFDKREVYDKYPSLSLGRLQASIVSPPSPFTSGLKDVQRPLPESDSPDMNPVPTQVTGKARSDFTTQPLEGAKPAAREPSRRATGWRGVDIVSSQTWPPKRINTWKKDTGDVEAESDSPSTRSQKEQSSDDIKPKYEHSRFTPDKYKKKHSLYTFMGFQSLQDRVGSAHWNSTTAAPPTSTDSSNYLRSAAGLHLESGPTTEPGTHDKTRPVATRARQFYRTPGRVGIGKRVQAKPDESQNLSGSSFPANDSVDVAIAGRPKVPVKVKALTFADILGTLSFGGVRATTQTLMTPADKKDYFPRAPAETRREEGPSSWTSDDRVLSGKNTSRGAKDEEGDFSRIEEKTPGFQSRAFEGGMKTLDALLDNEGSGSGAFSGSDVLSADRPQSLRLTEDLLEFDYLQTATGNISFKSVKLNPT
ncbi:uncharacterized protein LOC133950073 [Platichthys flesus]|uniref:uncharacterized protein LOC133950073 n=1 Tax=Platichthys flesus TaxID=8260 RepID=UPI002DB742A5|nr:uncharacterized protein LOC133950073 [Platichthys flesus]